MRIAHFETLKPVCPRCQADRQTKPPLILVDVTRQQGDMIVDGALRCSDKRCSQHYPIIDGIPIIFYNLQQYINENFYHITVRNDLSVMAEAVLGDVSGPGSEFNRMRHYLSMYSWDHYGDKESPEKTQHLFEKAPPGSLVKCLNAGLTLLKNKPGAPMIDIGCAVGRCSFELAAHNPGLVLGVDLNFSLLRIAQRILRDKRISFPLKRTGVVYDRHDYEISFDHQDQVDFWACDALALPFENESFYFANALNIFDAVSSPRRLLMSIRDMLVSGGNAILATPYDWTPTTPMQNWVGGHTQLGPDNGKPESLVRQMLAADQNPRTIRNFSLVGEIENYPWELRVHDRHTASYSVHIFACEKT